MAAEQILKSWLREKYNYNNTLKSSFGSGTTLTVPDASNSKAVTSDMNILLASLRQMQSNTYLRYSPLWSSVDLTDVSQGALIALPKKEDVDQLIEDLIGMCAKCSKNLVGYTNDTRASTFSNNGNASSFSQNGNASGFDNFSPNRNRFGGNTVYTRAFGFYQFGNASGFAQDSLVSGFSQAQYSRDTRSSSFSQDSRLASFGHNVNASGFFNFSPNRNRFGGDTRYSRAFGFVEDSSNANFSNNSQAASFAQNTSNCSQQYRYDFSVKSDGGIVTHSNTGV